MVALEKKENEVEDFIFFSNMTEITCFEGLLLNLWMTSFYQWMEILLAVGRTYILWDVVEGHVWVEWFLWWCTQTLPLMYSFLTVALQPESKGVVLLIPHAVLWCSRHIAQLRILCTFLSKCPLDSCGIRLSILICVDNETEILQETKDCP